MENKINSIKKLAPLATIAALAGVIHAAGATPLPTHATFPETGYSMKGEIQPAGCSSVRIGDALMFSDCGDFYYDNYHNYHRGHYYNDPYFRDHDTRYWFDGQNNRHEWRYGHNNDWRYGPHIGGGGGQNSREWENRHNHR